MLSLAFSSDYLLPFWAGEFNSSNIMDMKKVRLKDIIDEIDGIDDMHISYLDTETGIIAMITDDGDEVYYAGDEALERDDLVEPRFLELPSSWDVNDYYSMVEFIENLDDEDAAKSLARAIDGRGAFRAFKERARELGLIEEWWKFLREAHKKIAISWCKENGIEYEDDEEQVQ